MTTFDTNRGPRLAGALRTVSGIVLLSALALAPLLYGATRPLALQIVLGLLAAGGLAWLVSRGFAGSLDLPPLAVRCGVVLIMAAAVAWLFFLVPPELPAFTRGHFVRIQNRWPNSVVPRSLPWVMSGSVAMLVAFLAFQDLARSRSWRRSIAGVIVVTGVLVALLGLIQNATRASGIYWEKTPRLPGAFFGTFFHHTSAGAYLNTVWPMGLACGLTLIREGVRTVRERALVFGALVCATVTLAAHTGHISRLPQVIALIAFLIFVLWAGLWRMLGEIRGLRLTGMALAVAAAIAVMFLGATRFDIISERWSQLEWSRLAGNGARETAVPAVESWRGLVRDDLFIPSNHQGYPLGDRGAAYAAALAAVRERPWFGWGPGGWMAAAAATSGDPFIRTFFLMVQFTHEDFLQTCVEWGLVGAAGWALLGPGAVVFGVTRLGWHPAHDFIGAAAVTSLGAVFTQSLIDFPLQIPAVQLNAAAFAALAWSVPPAPALPAV